MVGDILQPTHLIFILVIALLVLGPKRLPEVGRSLGRGLRDFKGALSGDEPDHHDEVTSATDHDDVTSATATDPTRPATPAYDPAPEPTYEAPADVTHEPAGTDPEPAIPEPVASVHQSTDTAHDPVAAPHGPVSTEHDATAEAVPEPAPEAEREPAAASMPWAR